MLGVVAAALFYGDAMITPALSVLSAVEGLEVVEPALQAFVLPLTVVILIALFMVQSRGTAKVASFFGPSQASGSWHWPLAVCGRSRRTRGCSPLNPVFGLRFLIGHGLVSLLTLGAVFLAVTGAEALYADLGHFGRKPIQVAWLFFVLPALAINYFGQGALVLGDPRCIDNPFFLMYPDWARLPMVLLATAATVIASQAVITGAYSLTGRRCNWACCRARDPPHLGGSVRPDLHAAGQHVPAGRRAAAGVLFRSSDALASAYGIAVTGTMVVTAMLAFIVIWRAGIGDPVAAAALVVPFLLIDLIFFGANLLKIVPGRLVPAAARRLRHARDAHLARGSRILVEKTRRDRGSARRTGRQSSRSSRRKRLPGPPFS